VIDHRSRHDTFTHPGITLPNGNIADIDEACDDSATLATLADEVLTDPEAFRSRRCETSTGATIHPMIALRAVLTGHIRRVVVDSDGGRTDQRNGNIKCGGHNRFKHRQRWKTRRDQHGRIYNIRADGTIVLPAGERAPDLTADEFAEITRTRIRALCR